MEKSGPSAKVPAGWLEASTHLPEKSGGLCRVEPSHDHRCCYNTDDEASASHASSLSIRPIADDSSQLDSTRNRSSQRRVGSLQVSTSRRQLQLIDLRLALGLGSRAAVVGASPHVQPFTQCAFRPVAAGETTI